MRVKFGFTPRAVASGAQVGEEEWGCIPELQRGRDLGDAKLKIKITKFKNLSINGVHI